ncbi:MAG: T9SS type A sorting domain-containing protein [Ignavibacteriaceae bacterium]|nr:T9SS type A sorting domain-containing protein [Ignavibacteriaceae bacterium]
MKKKIFFSLLFLISTLCNAQRNTFNKEAELQKFVERGGKVQLVFPNVYKLTYPDGMSRVYNFNRSDRLNENFEGVDTTIINIWEIDTTKYADRFSFWQKVEVANSYWDPLFIDDLNKNGRPELYGYSDYSSIPVYSGGPVKIFERNTSGIFENVFTYDSSTVFVQGMGDIHGTGGIEIYLRSRLASNGVVYKSDTVGSLPVNFDFIFYYQPNQINDMTFGDFDQNGITECLFVDMNTPSKIIIGEFRENINNFTTTFEYSTGFDTPSGFAINVYDLDGKKEFAIGTGDGNMLIFENIDTNNYSLVWQNPFSTYNAYMKTTTNDIDENGKPEFWIGGQDFEQGITRFQCYEAYGDNSYEQVAMIELRYINSFVANCIQVNDLDNDGKEELIISIGKLILILKFVGSPNIHQYEIFYAKLDEATQPGADFFPVAIAELTGDEKKDILLPFKDFEYPIVKAFSYILKQDKLVNDTEKVQSIYSRIELNSYPSPFNSRSTIRFKIPEQTNVKLKVYNPLGREIVLLLENNLLPGEYKIYWDGQDKYNNPLPSGVYIISLQTEKQVKIIKTIFLK